MTTVTRPVLRYHGGKWMLAPWIIEHLPQHRIYVEPFGGAASVLLRKPRSYAEVYNDLSGELVNLFRVLRSPVQARELIRLLCLTPFARLEFEESYITAGDPIEQARRTIVRSFMGFGSNSLNQVSGFRNNTNRSGTTPAHDWMNYPAQLEMIVKRLGGVVIENRPAVHLIRQFDQADALFYVDPPYVLSTRTDDRADYEYEMTNDEHRELAEVLHTCRGMVVLSGYPSALYDELYGDWHQVIRSANADGAAKRLEVLWIRNDTIRQPALLAAD